MDSKKVLKAAKEVAKKVTELLQVESMPEVEIEEGTEGMLIVKVTYEGENLGYMIGNRGRHLQALQFLLASILRTKFREEGAKIAVMVDIGGYREQRVEQVEKIALQKADDARILGEAVELPPMSPSDRRIVHMALSKFDDIKTESEGEGRDRFVKIIPISEKELGVLGKGKGIEEEE